MSREPVKCAFCGRKIHLLLEDYALIKQGNEKTWFCGNCWDDLKSLQTELESQGFEMDKLIREYARLKQVVEQLMDKLNHRQK
jgi:predicted nuclease with TOPRIM domain